MQAHTKEHHDLMLSFERAFRGNRFDREEKSYWARGAVYQCGVTNELFKAYRMGYAEHRAIAHLDAA